MINRLNFNKKYISALRKVKSNPFLSTVEQFSLSSLFLGVFVFTGACLTSKEKEKKPNNVQDKKELFEEEGDAEIIEMEPISLSIAFSPEKPTVFDAIRLVVESNARTSYEWFVNGEKLPSVKGKILATTWFAKGDEVSVKVLAFEGQRKDEQRLKVRVENMPPRWDRDCRGIAGDPTGYRVRATDPDSAEEVLFELKGAPKGLSIGKTSGLLSYKGAADARAGEYRVAIVASDDEGATADHCAFSITVSTPKQRP